MERGKGKSEWKRRSAVIAAYKGILTKEEIQVPILEALRREVNVGGSIERRAGPTPGFSCSQEKGGRR